MFLDSLVPLGAMLRFVLRQPAVEHHQPAPPTLRLALVTVVLVHLEVAVGYRPAAKLTRHRTELARGLVHLRV